MWEGIYTSLEWCRNNCKDCGKRYHLDNTDIGPQFISLACSAVFHIFFCSSRASSEIINGRRWGPINLPSSVAKETRWTFHLNTGLNPTDLFHYGWQHPIDSRSLPLPLVSGRGPSNQGKALPLMARIHKIQPSLEPRDISTNFYVSRLHSCTYQFNMVSWCGGYCPGALFLIWVFIRPVWAGDGCTDGSHLVITASCNM